MSERPLVQWRWWITDERTGKRRLTRWHMSVRDALERYPDAEREPNSRVERHDAGSAAAVVTQGCAVCHGSSWVCEDHRALPWKHDDCGGAGAPCPVCNPEGHVAWRKVFASVDEG